MYLYTYHAPELNAIKIGRGNDPWKRMDDYSYHHGFRADHGSLQLWDCGENDPAFLESYVHNNIGLRQVKHRRATELFALKGSYEDAVAKIDQLIGVNGKIGTELAPSQNMSAGTILTVIIATIIGLPFLANAGIMLLLLLPVIGVLAGIGLVIWGIGWRIASMFE